MPLAHPGSGFVGEEFLAQRRSEEAGIKAVLDYGGAWEREWRVLAGRRRRDREADGQIVITALMSGGNADSELRSHG